MARGGGDQAVEQVGVLDLIAPAECLDHALDMAAALAGVLHQVEVSYRPIFLTRTNMRRHPARARTPPKIVSGQGNLRLSRRRYGRILHHNSTGIPETRGVPQLLCC